MTGITDEERRQIWRANTSGRPPVMFVHGLWLLANSWDRWRDHFEHAGYSVLTPGWPDEPETVEEANADPSVFDGHSIGLVADHLNRIIGQLDTKPAIVGHGYGGLLAQLLAGRGSATVTVAIDPCSFRGVMPLPPSAMRSAMVVLRNPANYSRSVRLTAAQFRRAFTNAVDDAQAERLYATYAAPAAGRPMWQAATANAYPLTEARVNNRFPERGPLLIISGGRDRVVPWSLANGAFKRQRHNAGVTEITALPDRGHSLTIDDGWREVADTTLQFVQRFVPA